jgi:hypothetical protein
MARASSTVGAAILEKPVSDRGTLGDVSQSAQSSFTRCCKLLILKRRDAGAVDQARLESVVLSWLVANFKRSVPRSHSINRAAVCRRHEIGASPSRAVYLFCTCSRGFMRFRRFARTTFFRFPKLFRTSRMFKSSLPHQPLTHYITAPSPSAADDALDAAALGSPTGLCEWCANPPAASNASTNRNASSVPARLTARYVLVCTRNGVAPGVRQPDGLFRPKRQNETPAR